MTMDFEPWHWVLAAFGAFIVGVSKTGIGGLGLLFVVVFAQIMPAKHASGLVLPLLIVGDLIAVLSYRRHTQWRFLGRIFPWTGVGVVLGYLAMSRIDDRQARLLVGIIIVTLVTLHFLRRQRGLLKGEDEHGAWFAPTIGILAGFTTLVANAAGPLMTVYLLTMRLPKMEFVGTGAVFFLIVNSFKVPFMVDLGLINSASFTINLCLAPAVLVGAYVGRKILPMINQTLFENLTLGFSALAGLRLLF